MNRLNILIFYQYFGTPNGKWSTRIYELSKRWIEAGNQVTVVTSPYEKSDINATRFIERQIVDGINLIVINFPDSNRFGNIKRIWNFLIFSLLSLWYAIFEPCDVVLASSGPITVGVPALICKWFRRKPFVFEVRDLWPLGAISLSILKNKMIIKLAYWFEQLCYENANVIVGCSSGMTENINYRFPLVRTEIIPNASDIDLFTSKDNPTMRDSENVFVYTGSIGVMDDVEAIIETAILIKERNIQDVEFEIIGEGVERKHLEERVKSLKLDNVVFTGLLPKTEVVKKLSRAKAAFVLFKPIGVLDTVSPNKMFDAFAAGVPIIQNTNGWIKEFLDQNKCGINVDPFKIEDLVKAVILISTNKKISSELSKNALEAAKNDFNRDKLAIKYLQILKSIVN